MTDSAQYVYVFDASLSEGDLIEIEAVETKLAGFSFNPMHTHASTVVKKTCICLKFDLREDIDYFDAGLFVLLDDNSVKKLRLGEIVRVVQRLSECVK